MREESTEEIYKSINSVWPQNGKIFQYTFAIPHSIVSIGQCTVALEVSAITLYSMTVSLSKTPELTLWL